MADRGLDWLLGACLRSLVVLLLVYTPWAPLRAQPGTATATGVVTTLDADLVLEAVEITVIDPATGAIVGAASTDAQGRYAITELPPGTYIVRAILAGFEEVTVDAVTLRPGATVELDVDLPVARLEEGVDVAARAGVPLDVLDTPMLVETLEGELLDVVPVTGENFDALLPLLPGVVRDAKGRLSVKGGLATQTSLRVNSVNVSDPVTGEFGTTLPDDAIDTVRLLPNPYAAEYGGFSAGVSEVETRRGTDEWTWAVTNFVPSLRFRDSTLQGIGKARPRFLVSGPLKPGRIHLAQSVQYRVVKTKVPVRPETANDNQVESLDVFTQLDADLTPNHSLQATLSVFPRDIKRINVNTFNPREVTPNLRQRGFNLALAERTVLSPSAFLESRVAFKRLDVDIESQGDAPMVLQPQVSGGNFYNDQHRRTRTIQIRESVTLQEENRTGNHVFKFGIDILDAAFDGESLSRPVEVRRTDGSLSQRITFGGPSVQDVRNTDIGLFFQDRWRVNDRLLFELGTRLDRNGVVKSVHLAPRVGFVLSLEPGGSRVLRGGAGWFLPETTLNVEAFESYEPPTVTWFEPDGTVRRVASYTNILAAERTPASLIWNIEYFHRVEQRIFTNINFSQRAANHELILNPLETEAGPVLRLSADGRSRYWGLDVTSRLVLGKHDLNFSYVASRAEADLNVFDDFYGNFRNPIVRANQFALSNTDTRHRFLFRGILDIRGWTVTPVLEVRQGFPYSIVDDELEFQGERNSARFPNVWTLDLAFQRPFTVGGFRTTLGLRMYHLLGSAFPRDVQANIDAPTFGRFSNEVERSVGLFFQIGD